MLQPVNCCKKCVKCFHGDEEASLTTAATVCDMLWMIRYPTAEAAIIWDPHLTFIHSVTSCNSEYLPLDHNMSAHRRCNMLSPTYVKLTL